MKIARTIAMSNLLRPLWPLGLLCLVTACASSPPTEYYSLRAMGNSNLEFEIGVNLDSIGVGPVTLPSELDRPGIVSELADGQIKVAGYHVWAGDLDENFTRVVATELSNYTGLDRVHAEPWDTRLRPKYQLRLDVQQFGGRLGREVRLDVLWTLTANAGRELLHSQRSQLSRSPDGASYAAYVTAMSWLLNEFARETAERLTQFGEPSIAQQAAPISQ